MKIKKVICLLSALLMVFGSTLTVSASELPSSDTLSVENNAVSSKAVSPQLAVYGSTTVNKGDMIYFDTNVGWDMVRQLGGYGMTFQISCIQGSGQGRMTSWYSDYNEYSTLTLVAVDSGIFAVSVEVVGASGVVGRTNTIYITVR